MKQPLRNQLILLFMLLTLTSIFAQDKIKGNKNVIAVTRALELFSSIEVNNNINVYFLNNDKQEVKVETDENIQEYLNTDVNNGVLSIYLSAKIRSSKALNVYISTTDSIHTITANDKSNLFAEMPLSFEKLTLNTNDNADAKMNLKAASLQINGIKNSDLNLTLSGENVSINLSNSCELKTSVTASKIDFTGSNSSKIIISGKAEEIKINAKDKSTFEGHNLTLQDAEISAIGSSDVYIKAKGKLKISASGNSEVYIFSKPTIILEKFSDKATLRKKEKMGLRL